jgi:hypothetical protein
LQQETKGRTLEELDHVFSIPTRVHAIYGIRQLAYFLRRYLLRREVEPVDLFERGPMGGNDLGEMHVL